MKKLKIIIYLLVLLELVALTSCISQRPNSYLWKKDFKGLKNRITKDPDFAKRQTCKHNHCYYYGYYSLVDLLSIYDFKGEVLDGDLLKFLIQNGAEIENKNFLKEYYINPLARALRAKRNHIAKILIEAGANTEDVDYMKNSALMIAAKQKNNKNIIEYLIKKGNNLNATNKIGITALENAINIPNNAENIQLLLKNGAKPVFKQDIKVYPQYLTNLKVLLKYNVSIISNNNYDYTKSISIINKLMKVYVSLLNADLSLESDDYLRTIHRLILFNDTFLVKKAINLCLIKEQNCKSFLNSYTYLGRSPIMITIEKNNDDLLNFLICKGADINRQNKFGITPLHIAILLNKKDAIKILLENNANTELKDIKGNTARDLYKQIFKSPLPEYPKLEKTQHCSTANVSTNHHTAKEKVIDLTPQELTNNPQ